MMTSLFSRFLSLTLLSLTLTSCLYQSPDEDFLQEIPTTNNPNITRDQNKMGMPV